jgi:hypothetical protein
MTLMLRLDVADCGEGEESATLIVAVAVPMELGVGVPVMAPLEPLIDKPPGKPLALKL